MKGKPPLTLGEMAARAAVVAGRLACPRCGCADFRTYKTQDGHIQKFRYKLCRHCGHKMVTRQEPEQWVRDVETGDAVESPVADVFDGDIV